MARTFARVANSDALRAHPHLDFHFGRYLYQITTHKAVSTLSFSDGARSISVPLMWAFGDGSIGQSYLFKWKGTLYESRVSYFETLKGLNFTPGRALMPARNPEEAIGRPVDALERRQCFGCQTTASTTSTNSIPPI